MNFLKILFSRIPILAIYLLVLALSTAPVTATAKGFSFIRDAEIENTIRSYAAPLFRAASLEPSAIEIYIVNDKSLNAFVAGGQKLFINSGLLIRSGNANQVIGVIAHETGHIASGDLSRVSAAIKNSSAATILSYVLGGAAAIATGRPDVGQAIISGGKQLGMRSFLGYSRTQEASADQAALKLLDQTKQSARGFLQFTNILSGQELLSRNSQDPYLRNHPLTQDRIRAIREQVRNSPYSDAKTSAEFTMMHKRMVAKLYAFTNPFSTTMRRYRKDDNSLEARYAKAIAYYRHSDLKNALLFIDSLISEYPQDPYFHELRGQMMFENAHLKEALSSYGTAARLLPSSSLVRSELAHVQLEMNDPSMLSRAVTNLRSSLLEEPGVPTTWRDLAIAYGRQGNKGMSSLAMAEEALLLGKMDDAIYYAGRADNLLVRGSAAWLQTQDILQEAREKQNKK